MTGYWEYPTNFSNGQNVSGVADFFLKYPSSILGNYFAAGLILMVWVATFALSLAIGTRKALAVSSFITLILAVYLMAYLNPIIIIALIFMTVIGLLGGKGENY